MPLLHKHPNLLIMFFSCFETSVPVTTFYCHDKLERAYELWLLQIAKHWTNCLAGEREKAIMYQDNVYLVLCLCFKWSTSHLLNIWSSGRSGNVCQSNWARFLHSWKYHLHFLTRPTDTEGAEPTLIYWPNGVAPIGLAQVSCTEQKVAISLYQRRCIKMVDRVTGTAVEFVRKCDHFAQNTIRYPMQMLVDKRDNSQILVADGETSIVHTVDIAPLLNHLRS